MKMTSSFLPSDYLPRDIFCFVERNLQHQLSRADAAASVALFFNEWHENFKIITGRREQFFSAR